MKKFYCFLFLFSFFSASSKAQVPVDSVNKKAASDTIVKDSVFIARDSVNFSDSMQVRAVPESVSKRPVEDSMLIVFGKESFWPDFRKYAYKKNNLIGFTAGVETKDADKKIFNGKEKLFYYFIFLLILFGLLRLVFAKYFHDLFRVFFRTTLNQRQVREQLLQSPLPSVLMNGFFVIVAGLYINFQFQYFHWSDTDNFWLQYLYCMIALSVIYLLKFSGLKLAGWLFNVMDATNSYIFIVFIINKMIGIFLLPLLVLIAFTKEPVYGVVITLSWVGIALLFGYRFILSYGVVRNEVKLNPFHFILYLLAFEVIPLLLIYKLLLVIL